MLGNLVGDHASLYGIFVEKGALSRPHNPSWGSELSDFRPRMHHVSSAYVSPLHNPPQELSLGACWGHGCDEDVGRTESNGR